MNRQSLSSGLKIRQRFSLWKRRFIQNYLTTQDTQGLGSLEDSHKHTKSSVVSLFFSFIELQVALLDLTPDIQTYGQEKKLTSAFQWPFFADQKFNKHIQSYMFSFKNIYSANINSSNLMFFTGPTKCGKSWLLRHNLEKFSSAQSASPVVFQFDFNDRTSVNAHLSFDMFLVEFEQMLIAQIVRNQTSLFGLDPQSSKQKLKPVHEIYQVAVKFYDKQLLEHGFAKTLNRALEQGSTFAFSLDNKTTNEASNAIAELGEMLQKYKGREYGNAVFADAFTKVTRLISHASPECQIDGKSCQVKAALLLIYDVCIQKEMNRRKKGYLHSHMHRDGIDCMNYFFDLINHCAGYTDKYYNEHHKRISMNDLALKYKKEREQHEATNFKDSELLGDKYPHCLLVLEGVQRLFTMTSAGTLPLDYLDTLVLRLNTGHDGQWYRNHFPVILETNKSRYFNELIYDDMMTSEYTFPTVEFTGYEAKQLGEQLGHIFNKDQMNEVNLKVGKSIFFNHLFVESVVKRFSLGGSQQQTFGDLLARIDGSSADSKVSQDDLTSLQYQIDPAFKAVRKEFEHRVNKLFVHPKLGHLLDNNEIDFAIMQVFEQILQFQAHETKTLFDCNIIWKSKYYAYFCFEHHYYVGCIKEWLAMRYNQMNRYERLLYYAYKKQNGLVIGRNGVGKRDPRMENSERAMKFSPQWELAELYYDLKERDENFDYA